MYITYKINFRPTYTLQDILNNPALIHEEVIEPAYENTFTKFIEEPTPEFLSELRQKYDIAHMFSQAQHIHQDNQSFMSESTDHYYHSFLIPKASGGFRRIDAPDPPLKEVQNKIKNFLENTCHILVHDTAYAFVPKRNP